VRGKHTCRNYFHGEGARGGCYFEIGTGTGEEMAQLDVGWSCVVVHQQEIPVTWLSELIAIATAHDGGIGGFLKAHNYGGSDGSYALMCNPVRP
jgi:hypothetical protein